jgi:hypothetical protein
MTRRSWTFSGSRRDVGISAPGFGGNKAQAEAHLRASLKYTRTYGELLLSAEPLIDQGRNSEARTELQK